MRYRYLDDFRRGISVFAIFSYGIAVLGTPQCPPLNSISFDLFNVRERPHSNSTKVVNASSLCFSFVSC